MTKLRVWQAYHPDDSPRKIWAAVIKDGSLLTRWGPAGQNLGQLTEIDLKGARASAKLAEMERSKRSKGYMSLGVIEVTDEGEILFEGHAQTPEPTPPPQPATRYFTCRIEVPSPQTLSKLVDAGYAVTQDAEQLHVGYGEAGITFMPKGGTTWTAAITARNIRPASALCMTYLAKASNGMFVDANGEKVTTTFDALSALLKHIDMASVRDIAEALDLAPKALAKSLKAKSNLFAFGLQLPT